MSLYILREVWTETYDCPDNGTTDICETYVDIKISHNKETLTIIADDLTSGYKNKYWTMARSKKLRVLYPNYDDFRKSKFVIVDISDMMI